MGIQFNKEISVSKVEIINIQKTIKRADTRFFFYFFRN